MIGHFQVLKFENSFFFSKKRNFDNDYHAVIGFDGRWNNIGNLIFLQDFSYSFF